MQRNLQRPLAYMTDKKIGDFHGALTLGRNGSAKGFILYTENLDYKK